APAQKEEGRGAVVGAFGMLGVENQPAFRSFQSLVPALQLQFELSLERKEVRVAGIEFDGLLNGSVNLSNLRRVAPAPSDERHVQATDLRGLDAGPRIETDAQAGSQFDGL